MSFKIVISRHVSPQLFQRKSWTPGLITLFDDKRRFVPGQKSNYSRVAQIKNYARDS